MTLLRRIANTETPDNRSCVSRTDPKASLDLTDLRRSDHAAHLPLVGGLKAARQPGKSRAPLII